MKKKKLRDFCYLNFHVRGPPIKVKGDRRPWERPKGGYRVDERKDGGKDEGDGMCFREGGTEKVRKGKRREGKGRGR